MGGGSKALVHWCRADRRRSWQRAEVIGVVSNQIAEIGAKASVRLVEADDLDKLTPRER